MNGFMHAVCMDIVDAGLIQQLVYLQCKVNITLRQYLGISAALLLPPLLLTLAGWRIPSEPLPAPAATVTATVWPIQGTRITFNKHSAATGAHKHL